MSFPVRVELKDKDLAEVQELWDDDDIRMYNLLSSARALELFLQSQSRYILGVNSSARDNTVTAVCDFGETELRFMGLIFYSDSDATISCTTPIDEKSLADYVLIIDVLDHKFPLIKGYIDLTKNPKYQLLQDEDGKFQIDPAEILTDMEAFAKLFE
jgi:hypothetical protein